MSVRPSLVFQQEAPGPARHLSRAAAADKKEAINPQKITSTDTLSPSNTAMQPDSFYLQSRQRRNMETTSPSPPCGQKDCVTRTDTGFLSLWFGLCQ